MTEEINTQDPTEEKTNPEGENPETKNAEKSFSQKELDQIVSNRLKREKDNFASAQKNWEAEKTELTNQIESLEKIVSDLIASQMEELSEGEKKLLAKLPVVDRVEYLAEAVKDIKKQNAKIPVTPKAAGSSGKASPLFRPKL